MIAFLLSPLGRLAIAAIVGAAIGFGGAWKIQGGRLASVKAEYAAFVAQAKAVGEAQEAKTKAEIASNQKAKEAADRENAKTKRDLSGVYDAYRKLRDARTNSGFVPAAAAGAVDPSRACFVRVGLDSAISDLDRGVTGLLEKGDAAIVDLNTAKTWAQAK
jgi:hypothetical protein